MSQINPVNPTYNVQRTQAAAKPAAPAQPAGAERASDRLELSGAKGALETLKANDVRMDKVRDIKAQIEAGTYLTDDKLDAAADRMLEDLL